MTDRKRLLEILNKPIFPHENVDPLEAVADYLIDNGVTFHKWVPVALGFLPEEHGRYLCVVKSFAFPGCFYQAILNYDKYGFHESGVYTDDVIYWMPLPEAPKEENNGSD